MRSLLVLKLRSLLGSPVDRYSVDLFSSYSQKTIFPCFWGEHCSSPLHPFRVIQHPVSPSPSYIFTNPSGLAALSVPETLTGTEHHVRHHEQSIIYRNTTFSSWWPSKMEKKLARSELKWTEVPPVPTVTDNWKWNGHSKMVCSITLLCVKLPAHERCYNCVTLGCPLFPSKQSGASQPHSSSIPVSSSNFNFDPSARDNTNINIIHTVTAWWKCELSEPPATVIYMLII